MKRILILSLLLLSIVTFSQTIEPDFDKVGNLVKATYYYDNGQVKQEGFYKEGKVHGKWVSYSETGSKISMGEFDNGVKSGKWLFWNNNSLTEVNYSEDKISNIRKNLPQGIALAN